MAYATEAEFEQLVGTDAYLRAADRDGDGSGDSAAVTQELENASGLADTYIARWLPISSPAPYALREAVIRIAHYKLLGETGNEEARKKYEDALGWLRDVAKGRASLDLTPDDGESAGAPDFDTPDRVMSRDKLSGVL